MRTTSDANLGDLAPVGQKATTSIYKFRSMARKEDAEETANILENEEFWFSPLWDQNDSIEAIYRPSEMCPAQESIITPYKMTTRICSFSTKKAIYHPLMWAHYASGFKGVAIELEPDSEIDMQEVIYRDNPSVVSKQSDIKSIVLNIMSSKSKIWEYESEVRLFIENTSKKHGKGLKHRAGSIRSVTLGKPYETILNMDEIYGNSELLKSYRKRARKVIELATSKDIPTQVSHITIAPTGPVVAIRDCKNGDFDD